MLEKYKMFSGNLNTGNVSNIKNKMNKCIAHEKYTQNNDVIDKVIYE